MGAVALDLIFNFNFSYIITYFVYVWERDTYIQRERKRERVIERELQSHGY